MVLMFVAGVKPEEIFTSQEVGVSGN
jgi:hypothetical protein